MLIITIPIAIGKLMAEGQYTAHTSTGNDANAPVTITNSSSRAKTIPVFWYLQ